MPPKKPVEEAPPAEECLPAGFEIGCEVFYVGERLEIPEVGILKPGIKGRLTEAKSVAEFEQEDGSKGYACDVVDVAFESLGTQELAIGVVSLEPPPLEVLDELSTGLHLPLTGDQVKQIWVEHASAAKQSEMIGQLLGLKEAYASPEQRLIVNDIFLYTLTHAWSLCLEPVRAAVVVAIADRLLARMRQDQELSVATVYEEFERLILQHAVQAPPERLALLSADEVRLVTDFFSITLLKQFRLYQYCINVRREVHTLHFLEAPERPAPPPDLNTAKPQKSRSKESPIFEDSRALLEQDEGEQEHIEDESSEIDRLVKEKLLMTERRLHARLEERERQFRKRLEEGARK